MVEYVMGYLRGTLWKCYRVRPRNGLRTTKLKSAGHSVPPEQSFETHGVNKLTQAKFGAPFTTGPPLDDSIIDRYTASNITCDANGNLKSLHRKGVDLHSSSLGYDDMADLYKPP